MSRVLQLFVFACATMFASQAMAKSEDTYTDPTKTPADFRLQGEYAGDLMREGKSAHYGAHVIALGKGKMQLVLYHGGLPGEGWARTQNREKADGELVGKDAARFSSTSAAGWSADARGGKLNFAGSTNGSLLKVTRRSPTLGAKPPQGAVVLFSGDGTQHWQAARETSEGFFMPAPVSPGAVTKQTFGDATLHIEFRTPFMPEARGQGRGNSGVYLQNRYEVQILDSFGLEGEDNECGGLYKIRSPRVNACFPPLSWQTYDIDFTAARYKGHDKVQNARITVRHNGVVIQDNVELPSASAGGESEGPQPGPLHLQWHGDPVTYRNIWIVPKKL